MLSGSYQGNFLLQLMVKDLVIAARVAGDSGAFAPMAGEVLGHWRQALEALGPAADHTEVARFVADRSGASLQGASAKAATPNSQP